MGVIKTPTTNELINKYTSTIILRSEKQRGGFEKFDFKLESWFSAIYQSEEPNEPNAHSSVHTTPFCFCAHYTIM